MKLKSEKLTIVQKGEVVYFTFPHFDKYNFVKHGFTSKLGGVSDGIYESLNLNFSVGDKHDNVIENYKIIAKALNINFENLVLSSQIHESEIKCVNKSDRGKGITQSRDYEGIDGLITNEPEVALVTLYADCVPLFFLDPVKRVVGLAHAGWKGTVKEIGRKMVEKFVNQYRSNKEDILVGIGPSIGDCCYEVGEEVVEQFKGIKASDNNIISKSNLKYMLDLWSINKDILIESGIKENNIVVTDICTNCNKDYLFSHRGHHGKRGGMAAIIQLEEK